MGQKKIVIMSRSSPYQNYFVNSIHEYVDRSRNLTLSGVFLSDKPSYREKLEKSARKEGLAGIYKTIGASSRSRLVNKHTYPVSDAYKEAVYRDLFGNNWHSIKCDNVFYRRHLGFCGWRDQISAISPNIIIVHGGGIVTKNIIRCASDYTFNLHWGLSPMYRGSFCTPFCILQGEIENIGVTIHELSMSIDGGDIYAQGKPAIQEDDTVFSIEMKLTQVGTQLISQLLEEIERGREPASRRQELSTGHMYLQKDYTLRKARTLHRRIKAGAIHEYVQNKKLSR